MQNRSSQLETHLLFVVISIIAWSVWRVDAILAVGLVFGVIGLFINPLARLVDQGWRAFSKALGWVMSKVVMGVIFIVVLVPIALLSRISRRDILKLKKADSYWVVREEKVKKEDLEHMW